MTKEKSYDKIWDGVFKLTAEELVKEPIDPILEDIFTAFENMSVTIEQNELPDVTLKNRKVIEA